MENFEYKVVPFIGKIKSNESAAEVSRQMQAVINENANDGWEFCQMTDVNIEVAPGCIPGVFGKKKTYVKFDQIVFKKSKN